MTASSLLRRIGRKGISNRRSFSLRQLLRLFAIDVVFDVGANVRQYTTMLRRDVGFKGLIISFEPHPDVFERLQSMALKDARWICIPSAVTDHDGTVAFNCVAGDQFSSLLEPDRNVMANFKEQGRVTKVVNVSAFRLDTIYADLQAQFGFVRPFLKLDTQGNDLAVAAGGSQVIKTFVGVQSELASRKLYEGSASYHEAIDYLSKLGFSPAAIFPNNLGHFPQLFEIDCILVRVDLAKDAIIS